MSKTILNRLNQILIEKLCGKEAGAHNVDTGNKINRTYDAAATYRPTNAQVVDELRLIFKKSSIPAIFDASADYSKYKGGGVTQDLRPLFKQTLIEVAFPAGYFSKASGCAQSMFYYFTALEKIDLSQLDTSNWTSLNSTFYHCDSLKELIAPENFISYNGTSLNLDLRYSPLTQSCVEDLVSKLADRTSLNAATLTLKKDVYDEYIANHPTAVEDVKAAKNWMIEYGE